METMRIDPDYPRQQVSDLIRQLYAHITMLPRELERDLQEADHPGIARKTRDRLARWCHPAKHPANGPRELAVQPLAQQISRLLFGTVIARQP